MESTLTPLPGCPKDGVHLWVPMASGFATRRWASRRWGLLSAFALWAFAAHGHNLLMDEVVSARPLLRGERVPYRNFALQQYENYPNHTSPYTDTPTGRYDSFGNFLMTGYDLYKWEENRAPGLKYGSDIFKHTPGNWRSTFDQRVAAIDGWGNWGFHFMVGDGLIARFTPLTLYKTDFNGVRFDLSTPHLKLTTVASRAERPMGYMWDLRQSGESFMLWLHRADDSTLLLGNRAQADIGALHLGLNWVNHHIYQSTQTTGNSLKGRLKPDHPLMDWIIVRFKDDSPADGVGGAAVQDVQLVVNGEVRPDLVPRIISHQANPSLQVGSTSAITGKFEPSIYNYFSAGNAATPYVNEYYYRGREIPLFADYFLRIDQEDGIDVSKQGNVPGLLSTYAVESPEALLRADGEREVVFLFDLSAEPAIESVALECVVGNDYYVEVATLYFKSAFANSYPNRFTATYYQDLARSRGNVQDLSNLKRRRFEIGENTGHFVYSADLHLELPGLEIAGEYARSSVYSRYPAEIDESPAFDDAPRFADRGSAYFLNAVHNFERGLVGGELFSINPGFSTEFRSYLHWESPLRLGHLSGTLNDYMYWKTVDDNDDGDHFTDINYGALLGFNTTNVGTDVDGVFLDRDEDHDGIPDTNRDLDRIPDYEEPFLMFDIEPNDYFYGLDRNNNDEPDRREDDSDVDYPYDYDERGFHLFSQWQLTPHWYLSVGHYSVKEVAGTGRNRSTYGLVGYRRQGLGWLRRIFFENNSRKVEDDIADEYMEYNDDAGPRNTTWSRGIVYLPSLREGEGLVKFLRIDFIPDLLFYQDSFVNASNLEGRARLWSGLEVVQKFRLRFNWQQGGELRSGLFQRDRRLDFWTSVTRIQHPFQWGKLLFTPQYKFMLLRLEDRERQVRLRSELRSIPILRLEYALSPRTTLRAGVQGFGSLPYRRRDDTSERKSFEQRTLFLTLTNSTSYFGYDLVTIVGFARDKQKFDSAYKDYRNFETHEFFVRALVGFTEFGQLL